MPFLETVETLDLLVAQAMYWLSEDELLDEVLEHPKVRWGSESSWEVLVVAADTVMDVTSAKVTRLLDAAYVESGTVETTHTPEVKVDIVRTGESKPGTIELVFNAILRVEAAMNKPLPIDHVVLVLDENSVIEGYGGTNHGVAISLLPKFEDPTDPYEWEGLEMGLIHEVAHYFWQGNANWIDEGMANITERIHSIEQGLTFSALTPRRSKCEAHDLEMLTQWAVDTDSDQFICNYYMGEMLFIDLLESLGREVFTERSHELYAAAPAGIEQIRQIFHDQLDIVERHWSGDWNAPENRDLTEGIERASLQLVQWNDLPAFNPSTNTIAFSGTLLGNAVLLAPHISIAREKVWNFSLCPFNSEECVGAILPKPAGGGKWVLDDFPGWSVAVIYDVQAQSFRIEFPFPKALETPTDYVVVIRGFQNAEREPSIGTNDDILGYARIRH